jgi:uncharacterized protein YigE (DUF2233 family)
MAHVPGKPGIQKSIVSVFIMFKNAVNLFAYAPFFDSFLDVQNLILENLSYILSTLKV